MDTPLRDYHLRSPPRGRAGSQFNSYLDTSLHRDIRNDTAPLGDRSSTPSVAVRRAMQVLDETRRSQALMKSDRWPRFVEDHRALNEPIRTRRSPSPIRSRSVSPIRNNSPPSWGPSRLVEIERENYQDALEDSEARREILLNKLADAQKTMEMQNERLHDGEVDVNESRATIRLLKQVQQELETKTQFLQRERDASLSKSRADAEDKEILRRKSEDASREGARLRSQLDLMLADKQQHHVTLQHMHKTIKDLKDQHKTSTELQVSTKNELESTKDQLNIIKQRQELLGKERDQLSSEMEKSQKKQQILINRNTELGQRLNRCQGDLQELSERFDEATCAINHHREEVKMCRDTIKKQNKDLTELRRSHVDLQSDRERSLKYNDELEKTVFSLKEINKDLKQAKVSRDDDVMELHSELGKSRLELNRVSDENLKNQTQLNDFRKACKQLSDELHQLRPEVDDLRGKVQEWEGIHKVDVQKLALLDAVKSQLACEKDDVTTRFTTLKDGYDELQSHHNKEMKNLNKEIKELRQEKEKIGSQCRDAQAQSARLREEMGANNDHIRAQLDHWRQACSKLTSLVEEKDQDLRECSTQRREAEEVCALAEAEKRSLEIQLNEERTSRDELDHLRMEQKRLSQECAENQQMISVLEMQRDILSKSPSKTGTSDVTKSQVEKLEAELSLTRSQLAQVEKERNGLFRDSMAHSHPETRDDKDGEVRKLRGMNQILGEQVVNLKQEADSLQVMLDEKSRSLERDGREWKREKHQLDLRMASMVDEINALKSQPRKMNEESSEVNALKAELRWIKQDLEEKKQELIVMKSEMIVVENAKKRADDRVSILEASLEGARDAKNRDSTSLMKHNKDFTSGDVRIKDAKLDAAEAEIAVLRFQAQELENTKLSQNTLIDALKRQLEKNPPSSTESDSSSDAKSQVGKKVKQLEKQLQRTTTEMGQKEKQLMDMKRKLIESQKMEQRARQERDELQGKAIIMESLNDSRQDLLKELDGVRMEKQDLEKQLNNFLTSKTSQTPPTAFSLVEDLDRELEKQYETVCERNKWLESRIASLQREIELLRDQNSLAQEQKLTAEREAYRLREELKDLQMTSKGSKRQSEVEQIHLQHRNAEKMQKILDLERELSEKKQLIRAMTKEMENIQRKSEKGKISSFMKKLRRSSDTTSRDLPRSLDFSMDGGGSGRVDSPFSTADLGYSTMSTTQPQQKRSSSLSPIPKSSSFGGISKKTRSSSKSPKTTSNPQIPLSPTLTYVTAYEPGHVGPSTPSGNRSRRQSTERSLPTRVSFEGNSRHEDDLVGESPSSKHEARSLSQESSSPSKHDSSREDDGAFFADDYVTEDMQPHTSNKRISKPPSPEITEPHPEQLKGLPSPTSSPSLPSPSMTGTRNNPVYVVAASDQSEEDSSEYGSEEMASFHGNQHMRGQSPIGTNSSTQQSIAPPSAQNLSPPRPRSQPTFQERNPSPTVSAAKKKHSSLV